METGKKKFIILDFDGKFWNLTENFKFWYLKKIYSEILRKILNFEYYI